MKTDKLEKFIINHREEFDDMTPNPKLWERVGRQHRKPLIRSINWKRISLRAAAVLLIFIASYFFHDFIGNHQKSNGSMKEQVEVTPKGNEMTKTFKEAEAFYTSQINSKKEEVFRFADSRPEIKQEINVEFTQLDSIFTQLKRDLKDNIDNQGIIEAMIQNYRIKLEILEDILNQLQKSKTTENINTNEIKEI
ncbi:MAG: hypothetical protein NT175_12100 [Bacteroidetes bacterium]|nr:hypothetical protein [Bacteroidota bacterium]